MQIVHIVSNKYMLTKHTGDKPSKVRSSESDGRILQLNLPTSGTRDRLTETQEAVGANNTG